LEDQAVRFQRERAVLFAALFLSACGSPNTAPGSRNGGLPTLITIDVTNGAQAKVQVSDARPEDTKSTIVRGSEDATYVRYGDDALSPAPTLILKAGLGSLMGEQLAGHEIVLTQFLVEATTKESTYASGSSSFDFVSNPSASVASNALGSGVAYALGHVHGSKMVVSIHLIGRIDQRDFWGDVYMPVSGVAGEEDFREAVTRAIKECAWRIDGSRRDSKFR
jgi:hypothetical protein